MQTYSIGTCPSKVIKSACLLQCPDGYTMTIRNKDEWKIIAHAVNQGIDSHLEALTARSSFNSTTGECIVHPEEIHVLLRRFHDSGEDAAWSLRSDILSTLDIEEI